MKEEQLQLKKELADVAITLNMEAHKIKQAEAEGNRQLVHTNKVDIKVRLSFGRQLQNRFDSVC